MSEQLPLPEAGSRYFYELTPERVLQSVERWNVRCLGRVLTLNSMENRVYEIELVPERDRAGLDDGGVGRYNNLEMGDPCFDTKDTGEAFFYMNGQ